MMRDDKALAVDDVSLIMALSLWVSLPPNSQRDSEMKRKRGVLICLVGLGGEESEK